MTENSDFWFDYDRTPRDVTDMNGRRLEIGEEPVKVTVFAPGFGRKYPWGHVQMPGADGRLQPAVEQLRRPGEDGYGRSRSAGN